MYPTKTPVSKKGILINIKIQDQYRHNNEDIVKVGVTVLIYCQCNLYLALARDCSVVTVDMYMYTVLLQRLTRFALNTVFQSCGTKVSHPKEQGND